MKEFDLNSIGKKMPYSLPEGLLEDVTSRCIERAKNEGFSTATTTKKPNIILAITLSAAAVAATLALILSQPSVTVPYDDTNATFEEMLSEISDEDLETLDYTLTLNYDSTEDY